MKERRVEPLSGVDSTWLSLESPTNLMMVSGILRLAEPLDLDSLKRLLRQRWLKFPRFRQRVVQPEVPTAPNYWAPAFWELDPGFDLDHHVSAVEFPRSADEKALKNLVSELMSRPLDPGKPLWQWHLVENYKGGAVLIPRVHHCIADGMGLLHVLLSITESEPGQWSAAGDGGEFEDEAAEPRTQIPGDSLLEAMLQQAAAASDTLSRLAGKAVLELVRSVNDPARVMELVQYGAEHVVALRDLLTREDDPETLFRGELGVSKRAAWSRLIELSEVKEIKQALGGTVNDILVTAMTGSLRRYLLARGQKVDGLSFRAAVPVDLRGPEERCQMGNKFGLVFLDLPVGIEDPVERLEAVKQRMNMIKRSREAAVMLGVLNAAGGLAREFREVLSQIMSEKATAVMTNVMGPPAPLFFAGRRIDRLMFWVPQTGRLSLGVSILSYAGRVSLGVASDAGLVPDPEQVAAGFQLEFERMLALARQDEVSVSAARRRPVRRKRVSRRVSAEAPARQASQDDRIRCRGVTRQGRQCRKRALAGEKFCAQHRGR